MVQEYNIKGCIDQGNKVLIPEAEYTRLLESVKNKKYIQNLKNKQAGANDMTKAEIKKLI